MTNIWIILLGVVICLGLIIVTSTIDDEQGSDKTIRVIISVINSLIVLLLVLPSGVHDSVWTLIEMRGLIIVGLAFVNTLIAYFWFYRHKGDSDMFYGHLGCNLGLIVLGLYMRSSEGNMFKQNRMFVDYLDSLSPDAQQRQLQRIKTIGTSQNPDVVASLKEMESLSRERAKAMDLAAKKLVSGREAEQTLQRRLDRLDRLDSL